MVQRIEYIITEHKGIKYKRYGYCERNCNDHCCYLGSHDEDGNALVCEHIAKDAEGKWFCTVYDNRPSWCLAWEPFPSCPEQVGGINCSYRFERL